MNNYHFYEQQAKGKFSVIFKARKKRKLDFVAIKRMEKTRKNKILNEARILTQLSHPNIIKFYEHIQSKNHMWAVTEYCPGGDLLKLVEQDKALPQMTVKGFLIDILKGLQYCHSKGVIVCDLKPASILINQYGSAKIGDFGSARTLVDLMHSEKQSKKGTPSYMAPQLFVGSGVYSMQSDFWSIGCIMFELSQGNPPFVSTSFQQIAILASTAKTPQVSQFSSEFNNLLQGLLMKQPQKRITWNNLCLHPWLNNQLKQVQMPDQSHFRDYLSKKQKSNANNTKFLRASQQISKDSYAINGSIVNANDRRNQFIFQSDQAQDMIQLDDDAYQNQRFQAKQSEEIKASAFVKKKQKAQGRAQKGLRQKSALQDSSNVNLFLQVVSRKNLLPVADLINHQSDNAVKPIIGNKDIQVIQSLNFNKKSLGFPYIEPEVLAEAIVNGNMQDQLKRILDGMFGQHKQNVMGYFESIIQNSEIANYLFKQGFIKYYLQMIKSYKRPQLRAKMFEIMGFLVRHATVIEPGVIKQGIITSFVEGSTKDKSQKVRRKAMAALGEILFYGATQVDEGVPQWDLSLSLIHTLQKILKNTQQDQIVRIYCCKSIQNITAQAKDVGTKFAQIDTLMALVSCFITCQNEGFRTSICSSFHHIIQLNSSLRQILLQKLGVNNMTEAFKQNDISTRSIQILLWIMISQFMKTRTSKVSRSYLEDQNLFRCIIQKLDRTTSPVAKGRIYLYIYYYLQTDPKKCLLLLQNSTTHTITTTNNKLFNILQKQNSSQDKQNKYQVQCLHYILVWLQQNYQSIIKYTHQDIKQVVLKVEGGYEVSGNRKNIGYVGIIWHMINCKLFQELFSVQNNLQLLWSILNLFDSIPVKVYELCEQQNSYANSLQQIKSIYMQILQKLTNNTNISQKLQQYYSTKALPYIVGRILKSQHQDIKFNCIKFLLYLITFYMNQEFLYDSTILNTTSNKISSLINLHFLPEVDTLLSKAHNEAVPTMVIKLLVVLFDIHLSFVKRFHQLNKIQVILNNGYFQEGANANVLKLVHKYITVEPQVTKAVPDWVSRIFNQNYKIMVSNLSTGQQLLLEHSLQIFKELMRINGKNWKQEDIENIWERVLHLQGHEDIIIRQKAQNLINSILESGRYGLKGKWQIKQKRGVENYQMYLQISGKQKDPKLVQNMNRITNSRYN